MDTKNAALYLGLSIKTLAMKRCDGTGPPFDSIVGTKYSLPDSYDGRGISPSFWGSHESNRAAEL